MIICRRCGCFWFHCGRIIFHINKSRVWIKHIGQLLGAVSQSHPKHDNCLLPEGRLDKKAQIATGRTQMDQHKHINIQAHESIPLYNLQQGDGWEREPASDDGQHLP